MIRNNDPMKVLFSEHELISKLNEIIPLLDGKWEKEETEYARIAEEIVRFISEYSDGYHHHKEEEVLFPALVDHPDFLLQGIIDELKEHHENFREYNHEVKEALTEKDFPKAQKVLMKFISELMDHIAIENDELFIMAENLFSEKELEEMYFHFEDIDRELGLEKKKSLEKMTASFTE